MHVLSVPDIIDLKMNQGQNDIMIGNCQGLENDIILRFQRLYVAFNHISNYWPDQEPLKWKIRDFGSNLILLALSFGDESDFVIERTIKDIKRQIYRLNVLLDVILYSHFLSETNSGLLKDELMSLSNSIDTYSQLRRGERLGLNNFGIDVPLILQTQEKSEGTSKLDNDSPTKLSRRGLIIGHIRRNGAANIRELLTIVKGCSDKTIQRELVSLIGSGVLRREGERRWSKYYLASTS